MAPKLKIIVTLDGEENITFLSAGKNKVSVSVSEFSTLSLCSSSEINEEAGVSIIIDLTQGTSEDDVISDEWTGKERVAKKALYYTVPYIDMYSEPVLDVLDCCAMLAGRIISVPPSCTDNPITISIDTEKRIMRHENVRVRIPGVDEEQVLSTFMTLISS